MHLFTLASAGTGIVDSFRFYILGRLPFIQMMSIAETMVTGNLASGRRVGTSCYLVLAKIFCKGPKGWGLPTGETLLTNLFCFTVCSVKTKYPSPKV